MDYRDLPLMKRPRAVPLRRSLRHYQSQPSWGLSTRSYFSPGFKSQPLSCILLFDSPSPSLISYAWNGKKLFRGGE